MSISERQQVLIQAAAQALVQQLYFTTEEAIQLIGTALREEMAARRTSLEALEVSTRSDRTVFVRGVVHRVSERLTTANKWPAERVDRALKGFMQVLHETWLRE